MRRLLRELDEDLYRKYHLWERTLIPLLLSVVLIVPLMMLASRVYTPLHEMAHAVACLLAGMPVSSFKIFNSVDCIGLGEGVIRSFSVYIAPYLMSLIFIATFHRFEKDIVDNRMYFPLAILILMPYVDVLMNLLFLPVVKVFGAVSIPYPDPLKVAGFVGGDAYILINVAILAPVIWFWMWRGRYTMLRLYDGIERNLIKNRKT